MMTVTIAMSTDVYNYFQNVYYNSKTNQSLGSPV